MPKTTNQNKLTRITSDGSPIIIADSSSDPELSKSAIAAGVYISHPTFRGTIEVTVNDLGYHAVSVQPPGPSLAIPLTLPWILTVNNSVRISSIRDGIVHIHFNSVSYDVGVFQGNPAFVVGGSLLNSVTLLNGIVPNANVTNLQVYQGTTPGATIQIMFKPIVPLKSRKKR